MNLPELLYACRVNGDARADGHAVALRSNQFKKNAMESAGVLVFQERRWFAGVEQQDVDVAIVEDIAKGRAPARVKRKCGKARFLADLVKSAVAIVAMEEQRLLEAGTGVQRIDLRSEEHTSELQSPYE